jgi:phospholipase/lecithinase/hemolysin
MSDIGNKRLSGMGRFARAIGAMRTNAVGRFSDCKNWTDFIWEWAGGATMIEKDADRSNELTAYHRKLNKHARWGTPPSAGFSYVNYAEGGAMGAHDKFGVGLGTFKAQYKQYKEELKTYRTGGPTLHIVWFGLNDLVTNGRKKNKMGPVAVQMRELCEKMLNENRDNAHFILANLPNPQGAVRFWGKELTDQVCDYQVGAFEFNFELARQLSIFQVPDRVSLVDMYTPIESINENLGAYGLKKGAQPKGVPVRYSKYGSQDTNSNYTTTSDEAHPTEAVYKIIAKIFAGGILAKYDVGNLRAHPPATVVGR